MSIEVLLNLGIFGGLIVLGVFVIPYILFRVFKSQNQTYYVWLGEIGISKLEQIYIFVILICILFFSTIMFIPALLVVTYLIIIYAYKAKTSIKNINRNTKDIKAFIIVFITYFVILSIFVRSGYLSNDNSFLMNTLHYLPINLTIFLMYIFGVSFKDFYWKSTFRDLLFVILLYLILKPLTFVVFEGLSFKSVTLEYFTINFLYNIYYPAFIEEILFRGLLLVGLLKIGVQGDKANIIHAMFFAVVHVIDSANLSFLTFLSTSIQCYIGYLFGKLYLSTRKLTPNIILHALFNVF
jgi:membrane protease YdiL (CAAX protease family)